MQHGVESPLVAANSRSFEINLRAEPPIGDEDVFFGQFDGIGHSTHVVAAIDEPGARALISCGRVASKPVGAGEIRS